MNSETTATPQLQRRFGLLPATALNMSNMIGIGPFITIPLLMSALGGPHSMLGWIVGALIAVADGLVWAELGAALPGSGGTYQYLRTAFGRETWGRLMAFLFIWQFIISGPMEIASGYIGFSQYLGYIWQGITPLQTKLVGVGLGLLTIALLYRRIHHVARLTVALWIGAILTTAIVIAAGLTHFDSNIAFDFPPSPIQFSVGFLLALGSASRVGIYDYLGYYDICYIGDEVREPARTIPRSILISVLGVAAIYFTMNLAILGVVPWREFVPANDDNPVSRFVVSVFMEKLFGRPVAVGFTLLVLWTSIACVFAMMLGYSRIPFAAAKDGNFFPVFGRLHPQGFPHVSLLVIGTLSIVFTFLPLGKVIDALITMRILVQFIGQIAAVTLLRRGHPEIVRPFKMWLYPLPSLVALLGWIFIFATTDRDIQYFALLSLFAGAGGFLAWSKWRGSWPFRPLPPGGGSH